MKKVKLLMILTLVWQCQVAYAQSDRDTVYPDEKKAADTISKLFLQRLNETGDIEPLIKEMFVSDFVERYTNELSHVSDADDMWPLRIMGIPALEYDPKIFSSVEKGEYRKFYLSTFRFMNHAIMVGMNNMAKARGSGHDVDDDKELEGMYPKSVINLLDSNPYLRNVYKKGNVTSKQINTLEDFRNVNKTFDEISIILRKPEYASQAKLKADGFNLALQSSQIVGQKFGYPLLNDIDGPHFGFPKRTRLIIAFATVGHMLVITKVGSEYKIIYAGIGSPD